MRLSFNLALSLCFAFSFISPSLAHVHQGKRHHVLRQADLAPRDPGEINLYKRFDGARFTYYAVGLGACGKVNVPSDYIVALDAAQFDSGSYCGQSITLTANGKTAPATIMDRCPGCGFGSLDLSQGLFEFFADTSAGVVTGSWDFGSGGSPPPPPSPSPSPPPPPPPPSPSPSPSPTPTSVDIPTTSLLPSSTSASPPPSTTPASTTSSSSSTTALSSSTSAQTATLDVAATAGVVAGTADSSVLVEMNLVLVAIGEFLGHSTGSQ